MRLFRNILFVLLGLSAGFGLGLLYSWLISPVTYVDANPAILRADFKDQYRIIIAAAYSSTHDLPRARARLDLLGDTDPTGELGAQAQRMLANGESNERVQPLAELAADLQQGVASISLTNTPATSEIFVGTPFVPITETPGVETPTAEEVAPPTEFFETPIVSSTLPFAQTPLVPQQLSTATLRPTSTPTKGISVPFTLVGQETVCDADLEPGLLQFVLMDSRRDQVAGVQIVVTWDKGEDNLFSGFKPEVGDGYADFIMQTDTVYSIRVVEGGSFVPNISAPICNDENGGSYPGGVLLTFQQP